MPSGSSRHHRSHQSATPWQDLLEKTCRDYQIQPPDYQLVSDRRGKYNSILCGRTAWSSVVVVYGKRIEARYWYDGNNLNNAREDAAEAALTWLQSGSA
ncbi:hypothetical protein F5Y16DRAFT_404018 [Xylariaceae sp. FL0255]|nr:hypothetical protein F5Y16DRAFT_404018 [Xylariaceae sp. FL0255]